MAPRSLLEVVRCGHHELELRGELCIASLEPLAAALAEIDGAVTLDMTDLTVHGQHRPGRHPEAAGSWVP